MNKIKTPSILKVREEAISLYIDHMQKAIEVIEEHKICFGAEILNYYKLKKQLATQERISIIEDMAQGLRLNRSKS